MSLDERMVRDLLDTGRAADALAMTEDRLRVVPDDISAARLRLDCLVGIGQFEAALEGARALREDDPSVQNTIEMLEHHLLPPVAAERITEWRPWPSEIPQSTLLRIQRAVHSITYRGVQMVKDPFDVVLYQMLVWRLRPRTIIEIGSKAGGSALMFADLLRNFGIDGRVESFDVFPVRGLEDPLITFRDGDGRRLDQSIGSEELAQWPRPWLVVEDADHSYETSVAVLDFFDSVLQIGDWIVVEDGNLSDMYPEVYPDGGSGPHRALRDFLPRSRGRYRIATELCDFFGYNATANSNGYLERIEP